MMHVRYVALAALLCSLAACGGQPESKDGRALTEKQAQVAERGRMVMPFDLNRTMHHFKPTPSGGVQEVVSKDGDASQIKLIREHLRTEAERFQRGDFTDPMAIHGSNMPGVKTLAAGARELKISYSDLPSGARITYSSDNPELIRALHQWFDAQVREHGRHAMMS